MDWLFQLSAGCVIAAALMLPVFRLFIVSPTQSRAAYRRPKAGGQEI